MGHEVNELLTHGLVAQQEYHRQAEQPICAQCGQRLQAKGKKRHYIRTRSGEVEVERSYYYCSKCQQGVFPLAEQMGLTHKGLSLGLAEQAVWLSSLLPYERAEEVLEWIGGLPTACHNALGTHAARGRGLAKG